jgi:hypothetical protein
MKNNSIFMHLFARSSIAAAAFGGVLLSGCGIEPGTAASGNPTTIQYQFTGFTGVVAGAVFDVVIKAGASPSVAVTVDDDLVEYLDVTVSGDRLQIQLKPNHDTSRATMKAVVTLPELTSLELSGASSGRVEGFRSPQAVDIRLSGASRLEGEIECGDLGLTLSGSSRADLKGSTGNLRLHASGASRAEIAQLLVKDANVEASGASHAAIHPSGTLHARASGASSVVYAGEPATVDAHTSGSASVRPK